MTARVISAAAALAVVAAAAPSVAQDRSPTPVKLRGSVFDQKLAGEALSGVVVSRKKWDALIEAWEIPNAPRVDFEKTILVVGTTRGSELEVNHRVVTGDLKVVTKSTRDVRPGFRYVIESVSREGVKTVNGQPLPKE